jgi:hypothetical protein
MNAQCGSGPAQELSVSRGMVGPNGFVFDVAGFMLTGSQILKLSEYGQLSLKGIQAFADSVKDDPEASKAMPKPFLP